MICIEKILLALPQNVYVCTGKPAFVKVKVLVDPLPLLVKRARRQHRDGGAGGEGDVGHDMAWMVYGAPRVDLGREDTVSIVEDEDEDDEDEQ